MGRGGKGLLWVLHEAQIYYDHIDLAIHWKMAMTYDEHRAGENLSSELRREPSQVRGTEVSKEGALVIYTT